MNGHSIVTGSYHYKRTSEVINFAYEQSVFYQLVRAPMLVHLKYNTTPMHWLVKIFGWMFRQWHSCGNPLAISVCGLRERMNGWVGWTGQPSRPILLHRLNASRLSSARSKLLTRNELRTAPSWIHSIRLPVTGWAFENWFQLGSINLSRWKWCGYLLFGDVIELPVGCFKGRKLQVGFANWPFFFHAKV